jgi:hypothetical protein
LVRPLVGPSVPISLRKLFTSQLLCAWGLVTTLFSYLTLWSETYSFPGNFEMVTMVLHKPPYSKSDARPHLPDLLAGHHVLPLEIAVSSFYFLFHFKTKQSVGWWLPSTGQLLIVYKFIFLRKLTQFIPQAQGSTIHFLESIL